MADFYAKYPSGSSSAGSNASVSPTGAPVPAEATLVGGEDPSGDLVALSVDASGNLNVNVTSSTLPTGAATAANQTSQIALETTMDASLNAIEASTASIDGKLANNYGVATGALRTASQIGNTAGQADFNKGAAGAQTLRVAIVNDQDPVAITGSITATNAAVGLNAAAAPTSSSQGGGVDGGGILRAISVDASGNQNVNVLASALPTGAATSALQSTGNASLASIDAGIPVALGQTTMANSMPVVIASDQSAITVTGTVTAANASVSATGAAVPASATMVGGSDGTNLRAFKVSATGVLSVDGSAVTQPVSGTVSVTGVSTAANQATEIASLASIDGKLANNYGVATGALRTASQIGNASGVADFNAGAAGAQTLRVALATGGATITTTNSMDVPTATACVTGTTVTTLLTVASGKIHDVTITAGLGGAVNDAITVTVKGVKVISMLVISAVATTMPVVWTGRLRVGDTVDISAGAGGYYASVYSTIYTP